MTYRTRNILIAVALAGFAALLVTFYVSNYKSSVRHQQASVPVLVAARDIPQNTTGEDAIAKGMLKTEQVTRASVVPGAVSSEVEIKNQVAVQTTYAGEQITRARFGPVVQQGVPGQITATQRAVQIAGDPSQTLAGVLQVGDYIDFEGTIGVSLGANNSFAFSRTIVRNLKVLAVQTPADPTAKISAGGSGVSSTAVLLRMTDAQAQKIMLIVTAARASSAAYWTLELRPGLKSQDSPSSIETPFTILTDGIAPATLRSALGIAVIAAAAGGSH
jgi:Flp pilus assembly protein CpaB